MMLVIDTATEACSVALFEGEELIAERHEVVGRGHAEKLVPMIAELPGSGKADTILVDCGPGSFTGVRVGVATARAFGLGWDAETIGYSSLAVIAAAEFANDDAPDRVAVTMFGGHGEMFIQRFTKDPFEAVSPLASLKPDAAVETIGEDLVIGNAAKELVAIRGSGQARSALPRAANAILLPNALRLLPPRPIYGRAPDAKIPV